MANVHPKTKERIEQEKQLVSNFLKLNREQQQFVYKLMCALHSDNLVWLRDLKSECPPEGLEHLERLIADREAKQ